MAQTEERGWRFGIDGEVGAGDVAGTGHVTPIVAQTGAQAVGLGLEDPTEVVRRPGERERAAADVDGNVGWIGGNGLGDDAQYAAGGVETVTQAGTGRTGNAAEVAGGRAGDAEQLERVAIRQQRGVGRNVGDGEDAAISNVSADNDLVLGRNTARYVNAQGGVALQNQVVVDIE